MAQKEPSLHGASAGSAAEAAYADAKDRVWPSAHVQALTAHNILSPGGEQTCSFSN